MVKVAEVPGVLDSPDALVAAVPFLVGFQPMDSIVGVWIKDEKVLVTQRIDIENIDKPLEFAQYVMPHNPRELVVLSYGECDRDALLSFAEQIYNALDDQFNVRDVIMVSDGRWRSVVCTNPECCPPEGKPIQTGLAAGFVVAGRSPAFSREDLKHECEPAGKRRMTTFDGALSERRRTEAINAVHTVKAGWGTVYTADDTGVLRGIGRTLHDVRVRDTVLWDVAQSKDSAELDAWYAFFCEVARQMHPKDAAPVCTAAATTAFSLGDGARALIALDAADAADAEYSLAFLLRTAVERGLPPSSWVEAMQGLTRDEARYGKGREIVDVQ